MLKRFLRDEQGATAIEYVFIAALVSIMIIAGARAIGTGVATRFTAAGSALS